MFLFINVNINDFFGDARMNDDELCKFLRGEKSQGGGLDTSLPPSIPTSMPEATEDKKTNYGKQCVILRKIFTITTLKIYPNGQVYVNDSRSWIDKDTKVYKKKKKKKPKKMSLGKIKKAEVL